MLTLKILLVFFSNYKIFLKYKKQKNIQLLQNFLFIFLYCLVLLPKTDAKIVVKKKKHKINSFLIAPNRYKKAQKKVVTIQYKIFLIFFFYLNVKMTFLFFNYFYFLFFIFLFFKIESALLFFSTRSIKLLVNVL